MSALKAHMVWTLVGLQVQARSSKTAICLSLVRCRLRAPENTGRQLLFVKLSTGTFPRTIAHHCQRCMEKKQRRYLKKKKPQRISDESSEESHQENGERKWLIVILYETNMMVGVRRQKSKSCGLPLLCSWKSRWSDPSDSASMLRSLKEQIENIVSHK